MLVKTNFQADSNNQEILPMDQNLLPYVCMLTELENYLNKNFPWHWHSAFEIDYIADGEIEFRTADIVLHLQKGDVLFINSGIMHAYRGKETADCRIYAHLFDMHFISGMYHSIFEQKYILPIMNSNDVQAILIRPDNDWHSEMIAAILNMITLAEEEPFGYEFEIRAEVCKFWCMLMNETEELRSRNTPRNSVDIERMKLMLQYIQEHYMERITLDNIAASANISARECTRCFQRCIDNSPINYLNTYRVQLAAQMLTQTNESILSISENCGFSTSSYFGKVFLEQIGCTPLKYRKGKK